MSTYHCEYKLDPHCMNWPYCFPRIFNNIGQNLMTNGNPFNKFFWNERQYRV